MKVEEFLCMLCEALGKKPNTLSLNDSRKTVAEWDSLGHLAIISIIAEQLDVSVDNEEMRNFTSIQELVERLKVKKVLED